jgi:hypothetical protein
VPARRRALDLRPAARARRVRAAGKRPHLSERPEPVETVDLRDRVNQNADAPPGGRRGRAVADLGHALARIDVAALVQDAFGGGRDVFVV